MILSLHSHVCTEGETHTETLYLETRDPRGSVSALKLYRKFYTCILLGNRCKVFFSFSKRSISPPTHPPTPQKRSRITTGCWFVLWSYATPLKVEQWTLRHTQWFTNIWKGCTSQWNINFALRYFLRKINKFC